MVQPLASLEQLTERLGYRLTDPERVMAAAALADASALVRAYGAPWPNPATAPAVAVSITLAAAERRVRNPEGYRAEGQGGYSYQLPATAPTGVALTDAEIRLLRAEAGTGGLYSVPVERHGGTL
ncbi:hypothetical protein [Streptomyces radicis]|uniref:Head-to-tail adaptor n=1 Tax=Streptomyces radicis TaxID=1750517 RepID=A0A3A9WPG3_9ACTN|nr:hypothetical protein [Streptomyces radicis]RKN09646.1 hypothetical protein D7319_11320 [Streptomyces radicis]